MLVRSSVMFSNPGESEVTIQKRQTEIAKETTFLLWKLTLYVGRV